MRISTHLAAPGTPSVPASVPGGGEALRVCDLVQFHSPISGGVKRFVRDKCRYLERVPGVEHCVIVPDAHDGEDTWGRSRVHAIASPRLPFSASYRVLKDSRRIREILTAFRPHVIEVGDPYLCAWIGRRLARRLGARVVGFYHSDYPRAWNRTVERFAGRPAGCVFEGLVVRYLRWLYGGMDALVVASRGLQALWENHGLGDRLHVVPLGVDVDVFKPHSDVAARAELRRSWGVPADAHVLLYVGRLAREKRPALLRDIFHALAARDPRVHAVFVGDGETRPLIEQWAAEHPRLHWQPYLQSAEQLACAYAAADVFVHAGLGETFGLGVLEAQSCGLPVIAARGSGLDDTVLPLAPSRLVGADDLAAWVQAVEVALAAPRAHDARHAAVRGSFPWWQTYSRLLALYAQLAGRGPAMAPVSGQPARPAASL